MRLRTSGISTTVVDGETVILDLVTSTYLKTNSSGTAILEALADEATVADLEEVLRVRYGLTPETARVDCAAFLTDLRDHGFLVD